MGLGVVKNAMMLASFINIKNNKIMLPGIMASNGMHSNAAF